MRDVQINGFMPMKTLNIRISSLLANEHAFMCYLHVDMYTVTQIILWSTYVFRRYVPTDHTQYVTWKHELLKHMKQKTLILSANDQYSETTIESVFVHTYMTVSFDAYDQCFVLIVRSYSVT